MLLKVAKSFITRITVLSVCVFSTMPLMAEEIDYFSLTFEELMKVTVYGSTHTDENINTVPSAVTVFSHNEIQQMGLDSLDELMNLVPGFQSYRSAESSVFTPFSARGRRIASDSSEVLIMIDGQRLDDPRVNGSTTVIAKYPLLFIERVEFIRGPGAAIYGSNAMMGVINIVTRSNSNELNLAYGSLNRRVGALILSETFEVVTIDLLTHIEKDNGDDFFEQDSFGAGRIDTDDPRELRDIDIKISWNDTLLKLQHHRTLGDNFFNVGNLSNSFNYIEAAYTAVSLKQNFEWSSINSWLWLSHAYNDLELSIQLTAPGALAPPISTSNDPLLLIADFNDSKESRVQWHNDWQIDNERALQFGIEFRHIKIQDAYASNNFDLGEFTDVLNGALKPVTFYGSLQPTTLILKGSERNILGLYGQYQQQLNNSTRLTLGLRYDDFSKIGSELSPRIGLVHELNAHHSLKLLYGEAFRAPSEQEQFLQNNPVRRGNQNLKPETVKTWDLIWIGQWTDLSIVLGYFESHYDNSIVNTSTPIGSQFQNIDQDPTKGIELEIAYQLNDSLLIRSTLTHIATNTDLSFREADNQASMMMNYQNSNWHGNLIATYTDEREKALGANDTNRVVLDAYWSLFAKVSYDFHDEWQGFMQVKNLLDEDFRTPTFQQAPAEGTPNRGREMLLGVTWEF